ncbi:MAG: HD domain-containing protein, partial [Gammaproteobacteria bacterium]
MVQAVRHLPALPEDLSIRPEVWTRALLTECAEAAQAKINLALDALFTQCEDLALRREALEQAAILAELGPDAELVIAALLRPLLRDSNPDSVTVQQDWGEGVAGLLESAQRLAFLHVSEQAETPNETQHENLRRMLLAMASDVRVVVLLLAERLYQLRHVRELPVEEGQRIARETRDILAPLANRLGIWQLKWQLEDLAFRTLQEDEYLRIARALDERREDRDRYIQDVILTLTEKLDEAGIHGEISGRSKHIFSIWKKIQRKEASLDALYDLRAVRILVDNVTACYTALGLVHGLWPHIPKEFDDYIAAPKANGYRSLHTAVRGPEGRILEVQIRTREMHEEAERGFAAHWRYKEGSAHDSALERKVLWLRQLLEWKEDVSRQEDFLERFSDAVAEEQIYV